MTLSRAETTAELADANRILVDQGVLDGFGHVSVRSPERADRFLLSRNLAPALVTAADVVEFDLDGGTEDDRPVYLERFIHSAIYAARSDVHAVIHSHSPSVIPFAVTHEPLRPIIHIAGFLGAGVSRFDLRDLVGDGSDLLIRDGETGAALAATLGESPVVLMRGHGFATAAESLRLAVFQAVYTKVNAAVQLESLRLGECDYLTPLEGAAAAAANATQVDRAWGMWLRRVRAPDGALVV